MKGDFSRDTFDRKKHYSAVLMQQAAVVAEERALKIAANERAEADLSLRGRATHRRRGPCWRSTF